MLCCERNMVKQQFTGFNTVNCRFLRDYVHNGCESQLLGNPMAVTSTDGYVVINVFSLVLNVSLCPIESSQ